MEQQASTEIPSYTPEEEKLIIRNKAGVPVGVKPHVKMTWKKILLWVLILAMIVSFAKVSFPAAMLQIPYLLWVTFAGYLSLAVALLN